MEQRVSSPSPALWEGSAAALSPTLRRLGGRFVRKWDGAWSALHSDSSDRFSQTAGSARELIIQLLAHLAPDWVFTKEEIAWHGDNGKVTRRMRIRRILTGTQSGKAEEWVEKIADILCAMHDFFVAEYHDRGETIRFSEADLASALMSTGAMLEFLIGRYSGRETS
ncbi:MAG: hypothetical protein H0T39_11095 [Actinobacteria bacterium]|nr:hypothetical protein [Actinomycetota bacterium]